MEPQVEAYEKALTKRAVRYRGTRTAHAGLNSDTQADRLLLAARRRLVFALFVCVFEGLRALSGVAQPPSTNSRACIGVTSSAVPALKCRSSKPAMKVANLFVSRTRVIVPAAQYRTMIAKA